MNKYYKPQGIINLTTELKKATEEFEFLISCKESGQSFGEHLDILLIDELAHLTDECENFIDVFNENIKDILKMLERG